ncbi:MAG: tetratricopeptide repeat protein, partial [Chloroflexi bacterium]|nr:tetratricopeptide repeat protein [Chloroflexota bacterium]
FQELENLHPGSPEVSFWLAWSLYENGYYSEAIEYFDDAIEKGYFPGRAHAGKGFAFVRAGDFTHAAEEFITSLTQTPDQPDVQNCLLRIQGAQGNDVICDE